MRADRLKRELGSPILRDVECLIYRIRTVPLRAENVADVIPEIGYQRRAYSLTDGMQEDMGYETHLTSKVGIERLQATNDHKDCIQVAIQPHAVLRKSTGLIGIVLNS